MMSDLQQLLAQLQQPIPTRVQLNPLLAAPLAALGLLPPQFHAFNTQPLQPNTPIPKHIAQLQRLILLHVAPVWAPELARTGDHALLTQFFVPDLFANARPAAGTVARSAYAVLLATPPLTPFALAALARLAHEYPVDRCFRAVFIDPPAPDPARADREWADCVRDLCAVPDRVANALAERARTDTPDALQPAHYFGAMTTRIAILVHTLATADPPSGTSARPALAYLLAKLVQVGLFPPRPPTARTQPSFFAATLPALRTHTATPACAALWAGILRALPSALALQAVLASLFGALPEIDALATAGPERARVRRAAGLLDGVVGAIQPGGEAQACWDVATGLVLAREWPEGHARVFVCWISGGARGAPVGDKALEALLDAVLSVWASPVHIKHSLLSKHRYTTLLLLLTLSYLPPSSPAPAALVSDSAFLRAIGAYIAHLDPAVRRCGMLAAEAVAQRVGRALDFGDWAGEGEGREWARGVRVVVEGRDVDAVLEGGGEGGSDDERGPAAPVDATGTAADEDQDKDKDKDEDMDQDKNAKTAPPASHTRARGRNHNHNRAAFVSSASDSDDSLTGYASPSSSRSPSPTPSDLAAIEADPSLALAPARAARPVYLLQLAALLRGTSNVGGARGMGSGTGGAGDPTEAERVTAGLAAAEELVRRKRGYGTELGECAVELVCVLLGLHDAYGLEGFAERRQGALTALVACAPREAAPTLIQEFFKNQYSVEQRFVALNALALGARELAALPVPPSAVPPARTAFPSKILPGLRHAKYLRADTDVVPRIVDDIARLALDKERTTADAPAPALVRERRLRVPPSRAAGSGITELSPSSSSSALNPYSTTTTPSPSSSHPPATPAYTALAAPYFIVPLIHAFWAHLQDAHAREARTARMDGPARFHGAGTGLVLSPMVLAQLLRTLAVLVHAAQHAPEWLAAVAPAALELALAVGTQRVGLGADDDDDDTNAEGDDGTANGASETRSEKEASVLASALEVALVVLDGALAVDGGRVLGLEHTALVLGLGEWAGAVFGRLERGVRVAGGGGVHAARLSRAAAGVLLKIEELTGRWSRSMLDMGR